MTSPIASLAVIVCLGALALIGLLPRIFFRRGRLNAAWWLTATPFVVTGGVLAGALTGVLEREVRLANLAAVGAVAGTALALGGAALIVRTIREHRTPLSLWHQEDDRPAALVTSGPYALVRHPFYSSFLLVITGSALVAPHALSAIAALAALVQLHRTARREEARLRAAFGEEYVAYMGRTGRFLPRLGTATGRRAPAGEL